MTWRIEVSNISKTRWAVLPKFNLLTGGFASLLDKGDARGVGDFAMWKPVIVATVVPDGDSNSGLTELCDRNPTISIVVISGQPEAMLGALQLVFAGSMNVQTELLAPDDASAAQPNEKKLAGNQCQPSAFDLGLTQRQLHVLALMMQGKSNKAICRILNLAEPTVKNHVTAILRALKVSNRTEAVVAVSELGWKLPSASQLDLQSRIPCVRGRCGSDSSRAAGESGHAAGAALNDALL
jgi:DNA-binding NarL/FixJ family response regulator